MRPRIRITAAGTARRRFVREENKRDKTAPQEKKKKKTCALVHTIVGVVVFEKGKCTPAVRSKILSKLIFASCV